MVTSREYRKRHHASKSYKKAKPNQNYKLEIDNPDRDIMHEVAKDWWNSWDGSLFIGGIADGVNKAKSEDEVMKFLKEKFYWCVKAVPGFADRISSLLFITTFKYCVPNFFNDWIWEEELFKRGKKVTGEVSEYILETLSTAESLGQVVTFTKLLNNQPDHIYTFDANFNGVITRLENRGLIEEYENNHLRCYKLGVNLEYYKNVYYDISECVRSKV